MVTPCAQAEFSLNWTRDTPNPTFFGTDVVHGSAVSTGTPFVYERVQDPVTGVRYYHMIIGDEGDPQRFGQEVYIQVGTISLGVQGLGQIGTVGSSSGGAIGVSGNGLNPLGSDAAAGNASGNPSRVQMRQFMRDGELTVDFVKDRFLEKPTISNTIDASDISMSFVIDGSGNPYTAPTASQVTNVVEHRGPELPPEASARFDMAIDAQDAHVTAGQYTTTNPAPGDPGGPYTYADPLENVPLDLPTWQGFFDHRETNPWSYPENRPAAPPP